MRTSVGPWWRAGLSTAEVSKQQLEFKHAGAGAEEATGVQDSDDRYGAVCHPHHNYSCTMSEAGGQTFQSCQLTAAHAVLLYTQGRMWRCSGCVPAAAVRVDSSFEVSL